jgi:hypothetical protein
MSHRTKPTLRILFCLSAVFQPLSLARGDAVREQLRREVGGYLITVFTSYPFRAGPVEVSVFVQDAVTRECVPEARVRVRLTARESGGSLEDAATTEASTNKLFHDAFFQLPESGWWDVEIAVGGPRGPAHVGFEVRADEAAPRWLELWPCYTWWVLVVALFALHQVLVRRRSLSGRRDA